MKARNTLFAVLMLSLPAISAEHSEMKMTDMSTSASSQEYMAGMKDMHDKMMAAVNESDPDKAFAKGMVAHHEGAIAMAETELKYGKDPKMRKLAQDIIKAQKGEIEQMNNGLIVKSKHCRNVTTSVILHRSWARESVNLYIIQTRLISGFYYSVLRSFVEDRNICT